MTQPSITDEKRAVRIAAIRELADWLTANPDVPMPSYKFDVQVHLQNAPTSCADGTEAENLDRVRKLAGVLGIETDENLDDRTVARIPFGGYVSYEVFAWHKSGRDGSELERLRAKVAELEAREALTYSREADDPAPVSPARGGPVGTGAVVDGGELVDETPDEAITVYFSFGHGQHDPDTNEHLIDKYVTIIGPSHEACREAMFASKYGRAWSFDYIAGTPTAEEWIPRWTEHERIVLPADFRVTPDCSPQCEGQPEERPCLRDCPARLAREAS